MNTRSRFTVTLVGIVTTCVLSAGAASAQVPPTEPDVAPSSATSPVAQTQAHAAATARAQQRLQQRSYIEHQQWAFVAQSSAAARSQQEQRQAAAANGKSLVDPFPSTAPAGTTSQASPSTPPHSGDGSEIPVLALTALAGLALGAAGSSGSRRLRHRSRLAV